MNLNLCLV